MSLRSSSRAESDLRYRGRTTSAARNRTARPETTTHFEHFYLSLQAAAAGLGVAIGSAWMVADDLRDGRLVAPFGFVADGSAYVMLSMAPFDGDPRRADFLAWVRHEMASAGDNAAQSPLSKVP